MGHPAQCVGADADCAAAQRDLRGWHVHQHLRLHGRVLHRRRQVKVHYDLLDHRFSVVLFRICILQLHP